MKRDAIAGVIKTHKKRAEQDRKKWDLYLAWYLSEQTSQPESLPTGAADVEDSDMVFETNYPYAWIDTMISNVVPQNPQNDWHAFDDEESEAGTVRGVLSNYIMRKNDSTELLWESAAKASLYGRTFIKTVWNFNDKTVRYYPVDPRYVFFDMSARRWEDIRYICEVTVITREEFNLRLKKQGDQKEQIYKREAEKLAKFSGYPTWLQPREDGNSMLNKASREVYKWVVIYEFYDFTANKFYHFIDDHEEPIFEGELPYQYVKNPFTMLKFSENHRDLGGLSDIQLIASAKERLDELDTLELWYAQASIPIPWVDVSRFENEGEIIEQYRDATGPGQMVRVRKGQDDGGIPLQSMFYTPTMPSLNPSWDKMRARAADSISFVLGLPEFNRGGPQGNAPATEVALSDAAYRTRNGMRQRRVFKVIRELGYNTVALYEEFLQPDEQIKVYDQDRGKVFTVNRQTIAARKSGPEGEASKETPGFEVIPVPYSPAENERLVRLQRLEKYLPYLMQGNPNVDMAAITKELLDLLGLDKAFVAQPQQPPAAPGAMPGDNPQGGPVGGVPGGASTIDTAAGGGLPMGLEPPPQAGLERGPGDQTGGGMI